MAASTPLADRGCLRTWPCASLYAEGVLYRFSHLYHVGQPRQTKEGMNNAFAPMSFSWKPSRAPGRTTISAAIGPLIIVCTRPCMSHDADGQECAAPRSLPRGGVPPGLPRRQRGLPLPTPQRTPGASWPFFPTSHECPGTNKGFCCTVELHFMIGSEVPESGP